MKKYTYLSISITALFVVAVTFGIISVARAFDNPTLGTPEVPLILSKVATKGIRVDMPGSSVSRLIACGPRWIFTSAYQVYASENGVVKNLTDYYNPYGKSNRSMPSIACNDKGIAYWLFQDSKAFYVYSYDGVTVTHVPLEVSAWSYPNFAMSLAEQTIDGQIVFVPLGRTTLWRYDGSNVSAITVVGSASELGTGDYSLVLSYGVLYKVVDDKALDISSQTGMKWIKVVTKIGDTWYIGGQPGPDVYEADFPNSFGTYDGTTFTDLSDLVRSRVVSSISGTPGDIMLYANGLYRYDGQQVKRMTIMKIEESAPTVGIIAWNGSYWLIGNFLGSKNDNTGLYRFSTDQDPDATSVYTTKTIGVSFRYLSIWDKPYHFHSNPDYYGFMLPAYKGVTYDLSFQLGTDGIYDNATMRQGLSKGWSSFVTSFLNWYASYAPNYVKSWGSSKLISRTVSSFPIKGLNVTKIVYTTKDTSNMDPKNPNQKLTSRSEYLLVGSKDLKDIYVFTLKQSQPGWTLSDSYYQDNFESMMKTIKVL